MLNNSSKIMFSFILVTGTLITISSNNWLSAWMGLEINLLSFIPLMKDNNLMSTEATLKYFLTQAMASATLLFAVIMNYMNNMNIYLEDTPLYFSLIMMSSLLLKMGAAPFHFWFPNVMEGLSWMNGLILMTWQKIAPLMLLSYIINNTLLMFIIMSVIVGSLGGLNQTSLRKLMAFSSINHLGWMLSAMQVNEMNWLMYFMFYSFLSASIIMLFNNYKLYHINQLFNSFFTSKTIKFTFFLNLISLGGLPPFIGFMPKWLVIQSLVLTNQYFLLTILMLTALVTLFFYIRLCFAAFMLNYYENNWILNSQISNKSTNLMLSMSFISTFGLILISLIYTIL